MTEDVLGPRQTVLGQRYESCGRCGAPTPRAGLAPLHLAGEGPRVGPLRPVEATREAPPVLLCAACLRDVAAGEPLDSDESAEPSTSGGLGEVAERQGY